MKLEGLTKRVYSYSSTKALSQRLSCAHEDRPGSENAVGVLNYWVTYRYCLIHIC